MGCLNFLGSPFLLSKWIRFGFHLYLHSWDQMESLHFYIDFIKDSIFVLNKLYSKLKHFIFKSSIKMGSKIRI